MTLLSRLYKRNINGIILTLGFHIFVFVFLNLTQLNVKEEYKETEIIIDFGALPIETPVPVNNNETSSNENDYPDQLKTNVASSKLTSQQNKSFDDQYQKDLEQAQKLVKDVSKQLTREIPTVDNLKMPDAPVGNQEEMKDKMYTGESNIEYYIKDRFHVKLPIPVYMAEGGGKVRVNIIVDRSGDVIKAEPVVEPALTTQILSYAKTAALRTKFNSDPNAPAQQNGYILYNFISQD